MNPEIQKLVGEHPAQAEVRDTKGAPRLFVNGKEVFPLLAWSWLLEPSAQYFKQAGIQILHPVIGLNAAWTRPDQYDWSFLEIHCAGLLSEHPDAFFLPRVLLDVPGWWKEAHPDQLIRCALPTEAEGRRQYRPVRPNPEGGWLWGIQLDEPSFASELWQSDMEKLLKAFLRFVETSPLRNRFIGYQIGSGIYGEWHYFMAEFIPDYSDPMIKKMGTVPGLETRQQTRLGLLRDPAEEKEVISYYRRFHEEIIADSLLRFARITKEETHHRVLCGTFYGYQLENVWMQDGGHLAPEKILSSKDIDFLAGPYSYQTTNIEGRQWWEHDVRDDAGNELGRSRGVGGDGGYRVLLESVKRHGKLYFVEIDPGTYLEPPPVNPDGTGGSDIEREQCMVGGEGSTTVEGTQRILQRDLGQMFARGTGGWLFDFGPVMRTGKSWYADGPIIEEVERFVRLGEQRKSLDLQSVARIAAVYDARSFFYTRHWYAESPFRFGGENLDFFTQWFMASQARALHRIGAPVDFLYRADLTAEDPGRYPLLLMVNLFTLSPDDVSRLRSMLSGSGATVVWYYAPGFLTPEKADPEQMERLTGIRFRLLREPGPMLIQARIPGEVSIEMTFGVNEMRWPRFAVEDTSARPLGWWSDTEEVAFAWKAHDGWNSVYVGSAPLPQRILRWLARQAGAGLWSTSPDIVIGTKEAALLVATSSGKRTVRLPTPMAPWGEGPSEPLHELDLAFGDVILFLPPPES